MSQDLPEEFISIQSNSPDDPLIVAILNHQKYRFAQLYRLLQNDDDVMVVIPIDTKSSSLEHGLGKGLAVDQWGDTNKSKQSIANLTALVNRLITTFPKRVKYGAVGTNANAKSFSSSVLTPFVNKLPQSEKDKLIGYNRNSITLTTPSDKIYHVWGANVTNWNLPVGTTIKGLGQAEGMEKQKVGIFGVITTPLSVNNLDDISIRSYTDTIVPSIPPINHHHYLSDVINGSRLNDQQKAELAQIIDNNNKACLGCIYNGVIDQKITTRPITTLITILRNSNVITEAKFKEYNDKIELEAQKRVFQMKYLKYKQKYIALKNSI